MADTIWLTENYLKANSVISDSADMKIITGSVTWCQDYYIKKILGTNLWEEINTQIGSNSVSPANQTLLNDYILKALLNYVVCTSAPNFLIRFMNKGAIEPTAEGYVSTSLEKIQYFMSTAESRAEWYSQQATDFLMANAETYPKYNVQTALNAITPNGNQFRSTLFLDDEDNYKSQSPFRQ